MLIEIMVLFLPFNIFLRYRDGIMSTKRLKSCDLGNELHMDPVQEFKNERMGRDWAQTGHA